jgi:hypothetical protein
MRKIESEMQAAIVERRDWSKSNTSVTVDSEGTTQVRLHNNLIATISNNGDVKLSSCGWETNTTKSRLNAVLDCFFNNLTIFQKNFVWYIGTDEFHDGYQIIR